MEKYLILSSQTPPTVPGTLHVISGKSNPYGSPDNSLYLLVGDATSKKIESLIPDAGVVLPGRSEKFKEKDFLLTFYHFNDLHGHLVRFTPRGEDPVISRMAWQIREKQKSVVSDPHKAVMVFSAGDDCIGSVFDELLGSTSQNFQIHAGYHLYSALGVDAACLGNHDFDLGSELLASSIKQNAQFPILTANLSGCSEIDKYCYPAAILVVKGVRIGIIGLVTQAELKITNPQCVVTDPVFVTKNLISVMRPCCDVVVILSHLGYSLSDSSIPMVNAGDVELAQSLPYGSVHLIIGGHSHHELNAQGLSPTNIVNGIPIVQTGALGRFLGQVDLKVGRKGAAVTNVRLIPTASLPVEQNFENEFTQPVLSQARSLFSRTLGTVADDPDLNTDIVRNSYASGELALANFITDAIFFRMKMANQPVDLAMIDSSSLRSGLAVGKLVTFGDWFNVMPFADTIRIYRLTGKQLYDLIQDNASRIDCPNEPHTERGFLQFSKQIRYSIVLGSNQSVPKAVQITVNAQPIEDQFEDEFLVAGTNFIREYAGGWEKLDIQQRNIHLINLHKHRYSDTDIFLRREIVAYIQEMGGVTREAGAICDGRLTVLDSIPVVITALSVDQFISTISEQKHAMAGSVIAMSAAQAVALGQACVSITLQNRLDAQEISKHKLSQLVEIKELLMKSGVQDANAIAEFVTLRESGQELKGKEILCNLPAQISRLSIQAAAILENFRPLVNERVRDDLEISINLLCGTAHTANLLLDSNLRIWPDEDLLIKFEPQLNELINSLDQLKPAQRIRSNK
ncbi:MAG: bifunctional metallophosphatase/5'-nucleotidase [Chloroflexi bacterium HGW-Chloroflexi-10]|nr:MAG: bifunctional metallophosphatase/5'-nucleotidase [Chloroflexi bacterium HGW-Chloroflexi-10]